jgi:insertion element IS1 protein InsB
MKYLTSDYWPAYERIIPAEKHIQSKAETFTAEGYNSLFRHLLARMRRKIKMLLQKYENASAVNSITYESTKRNIKYK